MAIEGVKSISSQSSVGTNNITVEFEVGSDLEKAANHVRAKCHRLCEVYRRILTRRPQWQKSHVNSEPIVFLVIRIHL
ncbi:MAG: efflux RND transporter permease subunit [Paludibacteraceae bacterium]